MADHLSALTICALSELSDERKFCRTIHTIVEIYYWMNVPPYEPCEVPSNQNESAAFGNKLQRIIYIKLLWSYISWALHISQVTFLLDCFPAGARSTTSCPCLAICFLKGPKRAKVFGFEHTVHLCLHGFPSDFVFNLALSTWPFDFVLYFLFVSAAEAFAFDLVFLPVFVMDFAVFPDALREIVRNDEY